MTETKIEILSVRFRSVIVSETETKYMTGFPKFFTFSEAKKDKIWGIFRNLVTKLRLHNHNY